MSAISLDKIHKSGKQADLSPYSTFKHLRTERIDSLDIFVAEYLHEATGAMHYHIAADNSENVFLVGLRTVPTDSKGVAHILEHTALCGSEKYPVRDPFFMMIRRSLNTFMNAFTSSDWTAYPFASQNKKDFDNLLEVYLDAVFFSRLDPMDFAQEGHRVEFADAKDANSDLVYKGVVFNEMKGAMSSTVATVYDRLNYHLFPTSTYHFNSGGEPEDIPDLSYQELKQFYQTHYHPSNAILMTYGDIAPAELQERFETLALSRFDRLDVKIEVADEKRYLSPIAVEESYALDQVDSNESLDDKSHHVLAWLLGSSIDIEQRFKVQLLSDVLLDNSSSPLRKALETSDIGTAPSSLCGLEDGNREMSFLCGIEGSQPGKAQDFEKLVISVLEDVAEKGVPLEQVEAMLHQLEIQQREIGGGHYPFGLQLILDGLAPAVHRGDPIAAINLDPVLAKLREDIKNPDFIPNLVKELLLNNMHRVRLTMKPDPELNQRKKVAETQRLANIKAGLSDAEKEKIVDVSKKLALRQEQKDDESILPKVGLEDVPKEFKVAHGSEKSGASFPLAFYPQGTNGLVYQQLIIDLPALEDELLEILPYYTLSLTELGSAGRDYIATQALQSGITGGLGCSSSICGSVGDEQSVTGFLVLSSKALMQNHRAMSQLLKETIQSPRFDESERIKDIMAQRRAQMEQSITGSGHSLAMMAASAGFAPVAKLSHRISGLEGIKRLKALDDGLKEGGSQAIDALADKFKRLHQLILQAPQRMLLVAEQESEASLLSDINEIWQDVAAPSAGFTPFKLDATRQACKEAWITSTQVNFCAKAYPTVTSDHSDAAALTVLGGFLRNGYLHRTIREQGGAYGGGASADSANAIFRFYSYRDPRLEETLEDFDKSVVWLLENDHEWQQVEEAILGVVSDIDKPSSPAGEAKQSYHNDLFGRTESQRRHFREKVLAVKLEDLKRVAEAYLKPGNASIAVVTHTGNTEKLQALGLKAIQV
ncbi:MAG: insulinase family protein [Pseudomonadales bacterium]|nr:insulinase family protein [Pseudomonadales bacterium]